MTFEEKLPKALTELHGRPLFVMRLDVLKPSLIGATPGGVRRVGVVTGGTFTGDRLSGVVLGGGSDWQTLRPDNTTTLDVRLMLQTDDGAIIGVNYKGLRHGSADTMQAIDRGDPVDPADYYFRINPMFETASPQYDWLNRILAIGIGHRLASGPVYSVFEVL